MNLNRLFEETFADSAAEASDKDISKKVLEQLDDTYSGDVVVPFWADSSYEFHGKFLDGLLTVFYYSKGNESFSLSSEKLQSADMRDIRIDLESMKSLAKQAVKDDIAQKTGLFDNLKELQENGWNLRNLEGITITNSKYPRVKIGLGNDIQLD